MTERMNKIAAGSPDFLPRAQNDFEARLKWSVTPRFGDANHAPVVTIAGPLNIAASAGQTVRLNGTVKDPDGNLVSIQWWPFAVGSYPGKLVLQQESTDRVLVTIPKDATPGQTIHIVLEATDNGSPALTAYQRVVILVR
jgi:hypothetical protein